MVGSFLVLDLEILDTECHNKRFNLHLLCFASFVPSFLFWIFFTIGLLPELPLLEYPPGDDDLPDDLPVLDDLPCCWWTLLAWWWVWSPAQGPHTWWQGLLGCGGGEERLWRLWGRWTDRVWLGIAQLVIWNICGLGSLLWILCSLTFVVTSLVKLLICSSSWWILRSFSVSLVWSEITWAFSRAISPGVWLHLQAGNSVGES